eukprot:m.38034 g.38034  ORF g.38034 m.38034 type:complete len:350 (-) comp10149_c0_seq1:148-1197(-)
MSSPAKQKSLFYPGFTGTLLDSDIPRIFEAAKRNEMHVISQRQSDWVRTHGLFPGTGYVFDSTRIQRWTDGVTWSDSLHPKGARTMIYKELQRGSEGIESCNGLRKKTIKDSASPLKIVYYYKDSMVTEPLTLLPPWSLHSQPDIDGALTLLSLHRNDSSYLLPSNLTHKEWTNQGGRFLKKKRGSSAPAQANKTNPIPTKQAKLNAPVMTNSPLISSPARSQQIWLKSCVHEQSPLQCRMQLGCQQCEVQLCEQYPFSTQPMVSSATFPAMHGQVSQTLHGPSIRTTAKPISSAIDRGFQATWASTGGSPPRRLHGLQMRFGSAAVQAHLPRTPLNGHRTLPNAIRSS